MVLSASRDRSVMILFVSRGLWSVTVLSASRGLGASWYCPSLGLSW